MDYCKSSKVLAAEGTVHSWQTTSRVSCEASLNLWDKLGRTKTQFILTPAGCWGLRPENFHLLCKDKQACKSCLKPERI